MLRVTGDKSFGSVERAASAWTEAPGITGGWSAMREKELLLNFKAGLLESRDPAGAMRQLRESGVIERLFPELADLWGPRGAQDPRWHPEGDTWEHVLLVLDKSADSYSPRLRISALFHDVGKPPTFELWPSGGISNHRHDYVGAEIFNNSLGPRLELSPELIAEVSSLIRYHMVVHYPSDPDTMPVELLEYLLQQPYIADLVALQHADVYGTTPDNYERFKLDNRDYFQELLRRRRQ